ncbi:MAG: Glutamine-hydrolyzing GMP synthase [Candidatus Nomurabacteria bacterium GW2011_GWD2_36_14]|nr:MAG: Glutamine-hydrolyzing GMP synthase [Candidatus Nomurabacteria bacterium GW2011_GWE2_36_115]KKP94355.1 MAG: Glutamine-hydrolyzing GMP synthase [Candidatus Nomurabacteria bacterium GW2011_GWF2_36_126]KKP96819.1 MAG: Glutamine-hydrolyzing GMP synthase [Candidatus Nomurabacteria bacterium GW2011_GWD2_36_14]KKP99577.1 MAG: Glutamine-hydrolyzing GMP synthase [Candidatus Nomurabacteria bacterium GW2011_GWF2_36_19]KKQ05573.1 MAG: Glutamine-hydrolyzing GMP synthase [Candidatus Nomurabacteria bac
MNSMQILIVDYGSQYTLVIGRTLRELGVRSIILPPRSVDKWLENNNPKAVILSGSNFSVHNEGAPEIPESLDTTGAKYLILGICYGMQLLAHKKGGVVERPLANREYGPAEVSLDITHPLFNNVSGKTQVWASHGDTVSKLPDGFTSIATSGGISAMTDKENRVMGIQFHPEVVDTKEGKKILQNFLNMGGCVKDWNPTDLIKEIQEEVLNDINKKTKDEKKQNVVLGVSGGVDSTTLASILAPILRERLICVAIDTGGLRAGELEELKINAKSAGVKNLIVVEAGDEFIKNVGTTIDGEDKRAKFRDVYKRIFEEQIAKYEAGFIVQGTLATDIIESGKAGQSAMIKTHHNVGLAWEVEDLHPFRNLFKYEVRELARVMNLPKEVYERNPFPGPGLFLRVVGTPVSKEKIELVRQADKTVSDIVKKYNVAKDISQLIVALLGVNSVGVKGDERVYGHSLVVRAVQTVDFMTAKGYYFSEEMVNEITNALTKHKDIVRVFFDVTPKPPATTEFE